MNHKLFILVILFIAFYVFSVLAVTEGLRIRIMSGKAMMTEPGTYNVVLTVTKSGAGSGVVTSSPAGINCGNTCKKLYRVGTSVTLTATPAAGTGSTFAGWSGGGCSGTGTCTLTITADTTVTANFNSWGVSYILTVAKAGTGSGTVTSSPAGINCGYDCTENYVAGTSVTLTAAPATGSVFNGWSGGGCSGTGLCIVAMNSITNVTAAFNVVRVNQSLYMRSDSITVNGLTAYNLGTSASTSSLFKPSSFIGDVSISWGIRVWKRNIAGIVTEVELTSGVPVAIVTRPAGVPAQGLQTTTWVPPVTAMTKSDSIVIRVYTQIGTNSWSEIATFTTEQLNSSQLNSTTWTVYYYTRRQYIAGSTIGAFGFGDSVYNSRIENFSYIPL